MEQNRRRVPRFPFTATAELIEEKSGSKISARVTELSLYGCYLDTSNPLEPRAVVSVKIFAENEYFEARASVVYSHPNLGMGLAFRDVKPYFLPVLKDWLMLALQGKNG